MSAPRGNAKFATTRWTLVAAAGQRSDGASDRALAELCHAYWPPLYGYLRGRGHKPDEAQDLTQGFFACLLERRGLRLADPTRGRFRAFLLTALKRYVINEHEHAAAARRGGGSTMLPLGFEEAERTYARDRRNDDTPERMFDRKWATIALDRAVRRLRDEHRHADKRAIADQLLPYLTDTGGVSPRSNGRSQRLREVCRGSSCNLRSALLKYSTSASLGASDQEDIMQLRNSRYFIAAAVMAAAIAPAAAETQFDRIVVFGTSLSDSGNAFALRGNTPVPPDYLVDPFLVPSAPYARGGHHFSNGATWVEQFARPLGLAGSVKPAFMSSSTGAANYAVGGARAHDDGVNLNLPAQVEAFLQDSGVSLPPAGCM